MKAPKDVSIESFDYPLSEERIAKYPKEKRDESKLLVYKADELEETVYKNIGDFLPEDSLLVFNNTRVIQARLEFFNANGARIELFCLAPFGNLDITTSMAKTEKVRWQCLIGNNRKWKEDRLTITLSHEKNDIELSVERIQTLEDGFEVAFSWSPGHFTFSKVLELAGTTPLPPYLKRKAEKGDQQRYQTVYAKHDGSVAAPTAGLHFTEDLLSKLKDSGIQQAYVTLHVGAGTFKPVSAEKIDDHVMHYEAIEASTKQLEALVAHQAQSIVAVGTTSCRTLESLYWLGVKVNQNPELLLEEFELSQWEPYEQLKASLSRKEAFEALLRYMNHLGLKQVLTRTQLIIGPGYQYQAIEGLATNFHQPKSTLLLLVSALIGDAWKEIYAHALNNEFRFLSYGDGCLLFPSK